MLVCSGGAVFVWWEEAVEAWRQPRAVVPVVAAVEAVVAVVTGIIPTNQSSCLSQQDPDPSLQLLSEITKAGSPGLLKLVLG